MQLTKNTKSQTRLSFIGKEKDIESSLGDFGVRKYDEVQGRFTSIDPLWEKYYSWTPYHYCSNNPVMGSDLGGMAEYYGTNMKLIGQDDAGDDGNYFVTTADAYNNAKSNGSWADLQGNKIPSKETLEQMSKVGVKENQEFAVVQDMEHKSSDIITGDAKGGSCDGHSVDVVPQLNENANTGKGNEIVIHYHTSDRNGACPSFNNISPADKRVHGQLISQIPTLKNSIVVLTAKQELNPSFIYYYNQNGKTSERINYNKFIDFYKNLGK
jgi:RHS repeat-associated protein